MTATSHRFPIRMKILVTLLFILAAVVTLITTTMSRFFHEDNKLYGFTMLRR